MRHSALPFGSIDPHASQSFPESSERNGREDRPARIDADLDGLHPVAVYQALEGEGVSRRREEAVEIGEGGCLTLAQPGEDDATLRRLLADEETALLIDRTWLVGDAAPRWARLRERLASLPRPVFPLEGRDVLALGEPEGPRLGALLRAVRQWWLTGGCVADQAACASELVRLRSFRDRPS